MTTARELGNAFERIQTMKKSCVQVVSVRIEESITLPLLLFVMNLNIDVIPLELQSCGMYCSRILQPNTLLQLSFPPAK